MNWRDQTFQPSFRRSRAAPLTSVSASWPWNSRWPNSVLGTRWPSMNSALPMPVPMVSSSTVPMRPCGRAVGQLRHAGRVRVVDDEHPAADGGADVVRGGPADPALVDVGRARESAVLDDARQPAADGQRVGHVLAVEHLGDHRCDGLGDRLGGRGLGRPLAEPGADQLCGGEVDQRRLDTRAPDIDAQGKTGQM